MYVYIRSESNLWTVGFYDHGVFFPETDWDSIEDAADRVRFLNGGAIAAPSAPEKSPALEAIARSENDWIDQKPELNAIYSVLLSIAYSLDAIRHTLDAIALGKQ